MTLEVQITDINGRQIKAGSKVCAYAQEYAVVSCDSSGDIPVVELDYARPKPIKDVPLFIGRVVWNQEELAFEIAVDAILTQWETKPSRIRMGGGNYAYELIS